MTCPRTGTKSVTTKIKQKEIIRMKMEGFSFPQIAAYYGNTQGYIYKLYKKALKEIIEEDVKEYRKLELLKLEALEQEVTKVLQSFHPLVNAGSVVRDVLENEDGTLVLDEDENPVLVRLQDAGPTLAAVDRAIKLMERRSKLLGLDKPTKVANTNPDGTKSASVVIVATPLDEEL